MNITDKQAEFAQEVTRKLKKHGLRVKSDLRNEKIGFKIREHTIEHVPYLLVIGDREVESRSISVRSQDGSDLGSMSIDQFVDFMSTEIERRGRTK